MAKNPRDEFVTLHGELKRRPHVEPRLINNVNNWHAINEGAILDDEKNYIRDENDLITIIPSAKTPLHRVLEKTHWFNTSRMFRHRPRSKAFYGKKLSSFTLRGGLRYLTRS
jgi:hypothetical protein